jgi:rubrerythrin
LRSLADRNVFDVNGDPWDRLSGREDISDILRLAVQMEKDSIVFYLGLKDMVPARLGGARIDAIIKEEMGHISTLAALAARWRK